MAVSTLSLPSTKDALAWVEPPPPRPVPTYAPCVLIKTTCKCAYPRKNGAKYVIVQGYETKQAWGDYGDVIPFFRSRFAFCPRDSRNAKCPACKKRLIRVRFDYSLTALTREARTKKNLFGWSSAETVEEFLARPDVLYLKVPDPPKKKGAAT